MQACVQLEVSWSTRAGRWLTAREALTVHMLPILPVHAAAMGFPSMVYAADVTSQLSNTALKSIAGNGMCLPVVGASCVIKHIRWVMSFGLMLPLLAMHFTRNWVNLAAMLLQSTHRAVCHLFHSFCLCSALGCRSLGALLPGAH